MMHGFKQEVPVDETVAPLSKAEREAAAQRYRILDQISVAATNGDYEVVKALATLL